ncbi:hypothetical protein NOJ05_18025 [Neorhizobium galegae]|uniref:hypothetical protein n=1 Tax=Neorhizobium galegae TaxID=399 RepID=UPI0021062AF3|nr:hypothetical protein [Neorhizobium galegae]MCQ1779105.1 hypothetical protein [Neorhizobium galegae]MCQ1799220.1 hypothetical protein [Neorhizobium galegae]
MNVAPYIEKYVLRKEPVVDATSGSITYEDTRYKASILGFDYNHAKAFADESIAKSIEMLSAVFDVRDTIGKPNKVEVATIGGAIGVPALTMRQAFSRFKELSPEKVLGLNPVETKRKWRRYEEAVDDFCDQMGEGIDVLTLKNKDAYEYRANLIRRIGEGEFKSDAANKKLGWLRIVTSRVFESDHPEQINPFEKVKITGIDDDEKGQPFTEAEVRHVRAELEKSGMSDEAKTIAILGECTGAGAKELLLLSPQDICLDADIPHIRIGENEHRKKVKRGGSRHREVPIVCPYALAALRKFPCGFEKFHSPQGPTRMNRALSDFFKNVVPGKGHYSYRHRLDDLLKKSKCDLGLKTAITGHTIKGEGHALYYGEGREAYTLLDKQEALKNAIAQARTIQTNNQINYMTEATA